MVVVMKPGASEAQVEAVIQRLNDYGFDVHRSSGVHQTVLGAIGVKPDFDIRHIKVLDGVANVYRVTQAYKFASRSWKPENSVIDVNGVPIGGEELVVMAGPCSVENEEQIELSAAFVASCGARILRAGAFKPRSSPYSFQGLGKEGLILLRQAADRHGLQVVTEVMEVAQIEVVHEYTDIFQVGTRNMQNYALLKELGKTDKAVLLKRGLSATIDEWLMSAEYIMSRGNQNVIFCERGVRTFSQATRNMLDLAAVPVIREKSHLPIIVDPSHATGIRNLVSPMALAAVAAGADGLMIETHPDPPTALSDGPQSLYFDHFASLMADVRRIAAAVGRSFAEAQKSVVRL